MMVLVGLLDRDERWGFGGLVGRFTYGKEAERNGPHEFGDKGPWK